MIDPRSLAIDAPDDTDRFARMTPEERLAVFLEVCALTESIVRGRPDAEAIRSPTPRSAASEALWAKLMERARAR